LFQKTATFKAISLFANTLDDCISDMAGDVHCQHEEHTKKLWHILFQIMRVQTLQILSSFVFIRGVTEDFQILQELHYLVPIKKGGDTILS